MVIRSAMTSMKCLFTQPASHSGGNGSLKKLLKNKIINMKKELPAKELSLASFSLRARLKSFRYAIDGITEFFNTQHNAIVHLLMTIAVFAASIKFHLQRNEFIAVLLVTGF